MYANVDLISHARIRAGGGDAEKSFRRSGREG